MPKKFILLISAFLLSFFLVIAAYFWLSPQNSVLIQPFLPKSKFSLVKAPLDSLTAKISSYSGNIAWQSRTASMATLIGSPIELQQGEELDSQGNGTATIEFPGNARIFLYNNTQIYLVQTLPANIVIQQKQGTAEFTRLSQNVPLSVVSSNLLINVISGKTSVSMDKKTKYITVKVTGESKIAYVDLNNNTHVKDLSTGNVFVFNDDTRKSYLE